jgi:hypothetical protein
MVAEVGQPASLLKRRSYQLIAKWARVIEADFLRFEPVDIGNNSVAGDDFGRVVDWDQSIEGFRPRPDIAVASGTSAIARLLPRMASTSSRPFIAVQILTRRKPPDRSRGSILQEKALRIGFLVYGVISLTNQFCLLSVSFVSFWFLLLIASFFQEKLHSRRQFIDKTKESLRIYITISTCN